MYLICIVGLLGVLLLVTSRAVAAPTGIGPLIWSDEFNGTSLNASKWAVNQPGKWGDGINTAAAVSVSGGVLKITAYTDPKTGKHYSAVVGTQDHFLPTYGYFESRIKFNDSPGEWSAFWLNSFAQANNSIVGNPKIDGTELDIAEHRLVDDTGANISTRVNSALHWNGYLASPQYSQNLTSPLTGMGNSSWHTYGLLWKPDSYTFYADDKPIWTSNTALSAAPEFLLLSSLIQNNTWAGNIPAQGYGTLATSTTAMSVDYVHVFSLPEPGSLALIGAAVAWMGVRRRR
jgi:beta-glucanase (GH16 family)